MARIELKRACIDYPVHRMHRGAKVNDAKQSLGGRIFVNHRREYVRALDRVDFNLVDGERIALLGSNGGGKSTLLNCAAGLDTPTRGSVVVGGRDLTALRPDDLTLSSHHLAAYLETAALLDRSDDPRVDTVRARLESLSAAGAATAIVYGAHRERTPAPTAPARGGRAALSGPA